MPRFDVDLTQVDLIQGDLEGVVQHVDYQLKIGEKWNKEGTSSVDKATWENHPDVSTARLQLIIAVPGKGNLFHELYFTEKALPMTKRALTIMGVRFTQTGYNPDEALNAPIGMTVIVKESAGYDAKSKIIRFYKV